jgi:hypothetical protein
VLKAFVFGVAAIAVGCGSGTGSALPGGGTHCSIQAALVQSGGTGATDCGYVHFGDTSQTADDCAVSAFMMNRPFFVSYDRRGTDSHLIRGLVGGTGGLVSVVDYDGNVSGGGGNGNPAIDQQACNAPSVSTTPGDRTLGEMPIACGSTGSYVRLCP